MSSNPNPYEPPADSGKRFPRVWWWKRICLTSALLAVCAFGLIVAVALFWFEVFSETPATRIQRAGILLALNGAMYLGILLTVVGAVGWVRNR